MADYYPLIARAIDGLSERTPEMRSSIYDRARTALLDQLRSLDPPLPDEHIERERLSLDDAIARVEADWRAPPAPDFGEPVDEAAVAEAPAHGPPAAPAYVPPPPARGYAPPPAAYPDADEAERLPPEAAYGPEPEREPELERRPEPVSEPDREPEPYPPASGPIRPRVESRSPKVRSEGRGRAVLLGTIVLLVVGVIGWLAWIWRDKPDADAAGGPAVAAAQNPADGAKFNERVGGGPPTPAPSPSPIRGEVGAAQRAVLYEEDPTSPRMPKATPGRVTWRIDAVNAGQGQPLATVVRAQVEIPDAGFTMTLLFRRNTDNTLPASHTAEIAFSTKAGESGRAIRDVGLLQFKDEFSSRGTPVAGQRVTLGENLFVIGLLSSDVQRNEELMKRGWIDLPLLMASGQRAVLTFEKGSPGDQAMAEAWRQWQ